MAIPATARLPFAPQPRSPRNAELALLGFAALITAVAVVIVHADQQQPIGSSLVRYLAVDLGLFGAAHIVMRRYAPYTDPLLLPIVALLNGLGLVMIHRLDLADSRSGVTSVRADQQMLWMLAGVVSFVLVVALLKDHRVLARRAYLCGVAGLVLLAVPALLPASLSEVNGAKLWVRLPGFSIEPGEFAKILLLIFFAAVLVAKRELFHSAGTRMLGMTLPRGRDLAPLLIAWVVSLGVMVFETDLGASLLLYASLLAMVYIATGRAGWVTIGLGLFAVGSVAV